MRRLGTGAGGVRALAFPGAIVAAAFIWSTSYSMTKVVLDDLPPLTIGAIRFLIAAALLRLLLRAKGMTTDVPRADRTRLATGGLLGITLYFAVENVGVDLATAADAALLVAAYPAITLLLESLLFGVRRSAICYVGVGLAMFGVYLIVQGNVGVDASRWVGDVLLILSGILWAFYNFSTRRIAERHPMLVIVYWQTLVGAIAFVPLALLELRSWQVPSAGNVGLLLLLAAMCSVAAFLLYGYGLKGLRSSSAVNLLNLVPVFGLVVAVTALGESVGPVQVVGGAIVIVGVVLGMRDIGEAARQDSLASPSPPGRRWARDTFSA